MEKSIGICNVKEIVRFSIWRTQMLDSVPLTFQSILYGITESVVPITRLLLPLVVSNENFVEWVCIYLFQFRFGRSFSKLSEREVLDILPPIINVLLFYFSSP